MFKSCHTHHPASSMSGCSTGGSATSKIHQVSRNHESKPDHITGSVDFLDDGFLLPDFIRQNHMWKFKKPQCLTCFCASKWPCPKWPQVLQLQQVREEWSVPPVERWGSLHWIRCFHGIANHKCKKHGFEDGFEDDVFDWRLMFEDCNK